MKGEHGHIHLGLYKIQISQFLAKASDLQAGIGGIKMIYNGHLVQIKTNKGVRRSILDKS